MLSVLHDTPFYSILSMSHYYISYNVIASDQFVNIVYMLLLYLIYLIGVNE